MTDEKKLTEGPAKSDFEGYCTSILRKSGQQHHQSRTEITGLTKSESVVYPARTVLKTPYTAVKPPRQSVAFVSPIGFAPMGGSAANKRPERGICPPSVYGFELLPTRLKNGPSLIYRSKAMHGAIPARPEQTRPLVPLVYIDIINCALRNAALAPTANDALDITGNALRQLVDVARAEVRHD